MKHHTPHAPGAGSDKQHPETPFDANEKFRESNQEDDEKESDRKEKK
jgi:hypothetical protein